jgi:hypothetical protein
MTLNGKTLEFTIIEDKQYTREPGSAQSGNLYAISLSGSIWSKEDTLKLLDTLTNLEKLPDEGIEGIDCVHYRGGADVDRAVDEQVANLDPAQPGYEEMLEAMERARQTKIEIELWIGKDDYLIRQMKFDTQAPPEDIGGWDTSSSMVRYYDFDKPIKIEPPVTASGELLPGWRLVSSPSASVPPKEMTFSRDVTYTIGDDDPAHQQISFRIIITNVGDETASNVRLALATKAANEEKGWIWNSPDQVTLEKGESKTYHITWEYDASHTSKEELARLLNQTTVLARYTTPEGGEVTQLLFPDAPYPSKRPPKTPPG